MISTHGFNVFSLRTELHLPLMGSHKRKLLMNRPPRLWYDGLKRSNHSEVKSFEDNAHLTPEFKPGDAVFTLSFRRADSTWVPGVNLSVLSPVNYQVQVEDVVWKRHRNQFRPRSVPLSELKETVIVTTSDA